MSRRWRRFFRYGLLAIVGLFALIGLATVVGAGWAWLTVEPNDAGSRAGLGASDQSCLARAIYRMEERAPYIIARFEVEYLSACLSVARETEGFCTDVPSASDPAARSAFYDARCPSMQTRRGSCEALFERLIDHCEERPAE